MDVFGDNPWLAWVGIALVFAAVEALTVDFVFVMLAGGAAAAAIAAALGANVFLQVVVALVVAILLLAAVRPMLTRRFNDTTASLSIGAASLAGRVGRVLQTVTENDGRIKLAGETWSARVAHGSRACEPGQEVRVISIEGATVIVTGDTAGQRAEL